MDTLPGTHAQYVMRILLWTYCLVGSSLIVTYQPTTAGAQVEFFIYNQLYDEQTANSKSVLDLPYHHNQFRAERSRHGGATVAESPCRRDGPTHQCAVVLQ